MKDLTGTVAFGRDFFQKHTDHGHLSSENWTYRTPSELSNEYLSLHTKPERHTKGFSMDPGHTREEEDVPIFVPLKNKINTKISFTDSIKLVKQNKQTKKHPAQKNEMAA